MEFLQLPRCKRAIHRPKAGQCRLNDVQRALVEKNMGLMRAALCDDPEKASFRTFAVRCIESEIRMRAVWQQRQREL